ncbi:hypothetical protein, partial [Amycolatopsis cihanbeyliensis]
LLRSRPPAGLRGLSRMGWRWLPVPPGVLRPGWSRRPLWLCGWGLCGPWALPAAVRVVAARPARSLVLRARPAGLLLRRAGRLPWRPALPGRAGRLVTGRPLGAGVLAVLAWRPLVVPAFGVLSWPAVIVHD